MSRGIQTFPDHRLLLPYIANITIDKTPKKNPSVNTIV